MKGFQWVTNADRKDRADILKWNPLWIIGDPKAGKHSASKLESWGLRGVYRPVELDSKDSG